MIKIELTDTILELHRAYFEQYVKPNFDREIYISDEEELKIMKENPKYDRKYILAKHKELMTYCKNNTKNISTGDPAKLKEIIQDVKKISCINDLIEYKVEFYYNLDTKKTILYKDILLEIFVYNSKFIVEDTEKIDTADFIMSQSERNQIIDEIMYHYDRDIKRDSIEQLLNLAHDKWGISKNRIKHDKKNFIRFWGAYAFAYLTGLKACPYCNRQYISPILTNSGMMRGDLDHFFPKDKYPYLSLSIYNLIPVCKFCNSSLKGKKEFGFNDIHPYEESIDDYVKFKINLVQGGQISINLEETNDSSGKVKNFIEIFKLNHQYSFHINQAEELIQKRIMYPTKYIEKIREHFSTNGLSDERLSEIIIGYIADKEKTNEEVLSKYRRDLVEQLGLDTI